MTIKNYVTDRFSSENDLEDTDEDIDSEEDIEEDKDGVSSSYDGGRCST